MAKTINNWQDFAGIRDAQAATLAATQQAQTLEQEIQLLQGEIAQAEAPVFVSEDDLRSGRLPTIDRVERRYKAASLRIELDERLQAAHAAYKTLEAAREHEKTLTDKAKAEALKELRPAYIAALDRFDAAIANAVDANLAVRAALAAAGCQDPGRALGLPEIRWTNRALTPEGLAQWREQRHDLDLENARSKMVNLIRRASESA